MNVMRWWKSRSVRLKLTTWYMSAMVVVIGVYAGSLFWALYQSASSSLNERLRGDFQWAAEMAEQRPDGTLTWFETTSRDDSDLPWLQVWSPGGQLIFKTTTVEHLPISESEWLAADRLTIADIVAFVGIDFGRMIKFRPPEELTHVCRWATAMRERPAAKAGMPQRVA